VMFGALRKAYLGNAMEPFRERIVQFLGTPAKLPTHSWLVELIALVQLFGSCYMVSMAIIATYTREEADMSPGFTTLILCLLIIFTMQACKFEFEISYLFSLDVLVDVITLVPAITNLVRAEPRSWLTFDFLRIWRVYSSICELENTGAMKLMGLYPLGILKVTVKFVSLVVILGGCMFIIEVLDDPAGFADIYIQSDMGNISFFQMCYFIFVTISTVGYGDFSPRTTLGRLFVMFAILGGVAFFSFESGRLVQLNLLQTSGRDKFTPPPGRNGHVIVCGGALSGRNMTILSTFLDELCHPSWGRNSPRVVLLDPHEVTDDLVELMRGRYLRGKAKFILGDALITQDLRRAAIKQAKMMFVFANPITDDPEREDMNNILIAVTIRKVQPNIPIRLMVLRPSSRTLAVSYGLAAHECYSLNTLTTNMMALSMRCRGASALIVNLARQDILLPEYSPSRNIWPDWLNDYNSGASNEIYGAMLVRRYANRDFAAAAKLLYQEHGLVLIAIQKGPRLLLNPSSQENIDFGDVVFMIGQSESQVEPVRIKGSGWQNVLRHNINAAQKERNAPRGSIMQQMTESAESEEQRRSRLRNKKLAMTMMSNQSGTQQQALFKTALLERGDQDENDDDEVIEDAQLRRICTTGGHVLVLASEKGMLDSIASFVGNLRTEEQLTWLPIVIVCPYKLPPSLFAKFPSLFQVQRKPRTIQTLLAVGVENAEAVCILASSAMETGTPAPVMDILGVLTEGVIQSLCNARGSSNFNIVEMHNPDNVNQVNITFNASEPSVMQMHRATATTPDIVQLEINGGEDPDFGDAGDKNALSEGEDQTTSSGLFKSLSFGTSKPVPVKKVTSNLPPRMLASLPPELHPRTAAGSVYFRTDICRLFAISFHTAGIMEVVEALSCSTETQPSCLWSLPMRSEWTGMKYANLMELLFDGGAVCLGLYRSVQTPGKFNDLPYVHTNPERDELLLSTDMLLVLASTRWARMYNLGANAVTHKAVLSIQKRWRMRRAERRRRLERAQRDMAERKQERAKAAVMQKQLQTETATGNTLGNFMSLRL